MTAHHILQRQKLAAAFAAAVEGFVTATVPTVEQPPVNAAPYDAPNLKSGYLPPPPTIDPNVPLDEPEAPDMLAGLGLRAEDLAAIQGQVAAVIRPMMRDHYRAQLMAAVIQGSIAADKALPPESMAKTATHYADAALKEMGL